MKIYPGRGVDNVLFGMTEPEIRAALGKPDKTVHNDSGSRDLFYKRFQLILKFAPANEDRLGWITVLNREAAWSCLNPWEMACEQLLETLSKRFGEPFEFDDYGHMESYTLDKIPIELQYQCGKLTAFNLGVPYDEFDEPKWPNRANLTLVSCSSKEPRAKVRPSTILGSDLRTRIEELFDGCAFKRPLFYSYPGGLRFGLSDGGSPFDQVLLALRKATPICELAFTGETTVTVCLRKYALPGRFHYRPTLRELKMAGISIPRTRCIWLEPFDQEERFDEDVEGRWLTLAFEVTPDAIQNLLWSAFTLDFPSLHPNPRCGVYLFSLQKQIVVFPYDDRGMDIVGKDRALLDRLYTEYNDCLLDYDRAQMDATFAGGG